MKLRCRIDRRRRAPIAVRRGSPARKTCGFWGNTKKKGKKMRVRVRVTATDHGKETSATEALYYYPV
ncbi:hypothetical protein E2542_SST20420 [Spatholobus suberectus]|nr:hypothetical protein E2542_SST20420 [Spatholobus suberectus]